MIQYPSAHQEKKNSNVMCAYKQAKYTEKRKEEFFIFLQIFLHMLKFSKTSTTSTLFCGIAILGDIVISFHETML